MTNWAQIFTGLLFYAYMPSQKTGLWQLPNVSSTFNEKGKGLPSGQEEKINVNNGPGAVMTEMKEIVGGDNHNVYP